MDKGLVYDVGVNDGSDTAYYLHLGFRVVGIEASPVMAEQLRKRFTNEIADGRLMLLPVGVAQYDGEMEFWLSSHAGWSSFDRSIASRNDTPHRAISVPTRRFENIVEEYGVPYYCKIDIEGNDHLCLEGMSIDTAPLFISIELSHARGDSDLQLLHSLGYERFKIISQLTRAQPFRLLTRLGYSLTPHRSALVRRATKLMFGRNRVGQWIFPRGSSGPFGSDTPGPWRDIGWTLCRWRFLHDLDLEFRTHGLGEWFDIHASRRANGTRR